MRVRRGRLEDLEFELRDARGIRLAWAHVDRASASEVQLDGPAVSPTASSYLFLPDLDIEDASFDLDLFNLNPPAAELPADVDPPPSVPRKFGDFASLRPVLEAIDGDLSVILFVSVKAALGWQDIQIGGTTSPLAVPLSGGAVDVPTFEKNIEKAGISATYNPSWATRAGQTQILSLREWVVEFGGNKPLLRLTTGGEMQLGAYAVKNPSRANEGNDSLGENRPDDFDWAPFLSWDLHPVDLQRAMVDRFALWSAIFRLKQTPDAGTLAERTAARLQQRAILDSLEVRRLVGNVNVRSNAPIPVPIDSPKVKGEIVLAKDAVMGLTFAGGIPAVAMPSVRDSIDPPRRHGLDIGLEALTLDRVWLAITGGGEAETGTITIEWLREAHLSFSQVHRFTPSRLKGTITSARAKNISWNAPH